MTKFDVWKWLQSDKNYFKGVELLEAIQPKHVLLASLKNGVTFMNRRYLEASMKKLHKDFPVKVKVTVESKKNISQLETKKMSQADFYRIAEKELAKAYLRRRKLSNQFQLCNTDEERSEISDKIKNTIAETNDLKARISVFKTTGVMPPPTKQSHKIKLNELNDVALQKEILNFRAKVATQKRLLLNYDKKSRRKTKAEHDLKLSQLQKTLKSLINEQENRDQAD